MITRIEEAVKTCTIVRICLFGVCLYRRQWQGSAVKIWLLGVPVYRTEVRW